MLLANLIREISALNISNFRIDMSADFYSREISGLNISNFQIDMTANRYLMDDIFVLISISQGGVVLSSDNTDGYLLFKSVKAAVRESLYLAKNSILQLSHDDTHPLTMEISKHSLISALLKIDSDERLISKLVKAIQDNYKRACEQVEGVVQAGSDTLLLRPKSPVREVGFFSPDSAAFGGVKVNVTWFYQAVNTFYENLGAELKESDQISADALEQFKQHLIKAAGEIDVWRQYLVPILCNKLRLIQWLQSANQVSKYIQNTMFGDAPPNYIIQHGVITPVIDSNAKHGARFGMGVQELLEARLFPNRTFFAAEAKIQEDTLGTLFIAPNL